MPSSLKTWIGGMGLFSLMIACGGSTTDNPPGTGSGGSAGTAGTSGGGSAGTSGQGTTIGTTTGPGSTTVVGAGGSGGSAGGGAGGSAGGGGSKGVDAIAWLDTGEMLQPTTLIVAINALGLSCAAPDFHVSPSQQTALLLVGLPEAMQKPGTYPFSSTDVIAWGSFWVGDGMGNGGGGSMTLQKGTIEVVAIAADSVDVRFAGLPTYFEVYDGAHSATRCP